MRVEQLGTGEPEVAIVGGVHGDEPCGVRAVEALLAERPPVERPVKLVVANEAAVDRGARYVDEDLNRAFPGDRDADPHERRLAAALLSELRGCTTFSLHSTQSHAEPFAVVDGVDGLAREVCPRLPVESVVDVGSFTEGRLIAHARVVEAECGRQDTDRAAANADRLARAFLGAVGALPGEAATARSLPVYRLSRLVAKPPGDVHEVYVGNFRRVAAGEPFAAVDGEPLVAAEPFYPVLMSSRGYENVFGYAARRAGRLGG